MPRITPRTAQAVDVESELLRLLAAGVRTPERWREAARKAIAALHHGHGTPRVRDAGMALLDVALSAGVDPSDTDAREALWQAYGPQVQQAWREQLMPGVPPEFDPDEPF